MMVVGGNTMEGWVANYEVGKVDKELNYWGWVGREGRGLGRMEWLAVEDMGMELLTVVGMEVLEGRRMVGWEAQDWEGRDLSKMGLWALVAEVGLDREGKVMVGLVEKDTEEMGLGMMVMLVGMHTVDRVKVD